MTSRKPDMHTESRIALSVGGDLDEDSQAELDRRIATCPETRACHAEMEESLSVLHACRDAHLEVGDPEGSLWPELSTRLPERRTLGPLESLRAWVPAITVAALVLALATVGTSPRRRPVPPRPNTWPASEASFRLPPQRDPDPFPSPRFGIPFHPNHDAEPLSHRRGDDAPPQLRLR